MIIRASTYLQLSLFMAAASSCSNPECGDSEIKVADTCYPKREAATDSSVFGAQSHAHSDAASLTPLSLQDAAASIDAAQSDGLAAAPVGPMDAAGNVADSAVLLLPDGAALLPACTPSEERCDGLDNDCDGEADEGVRTLCWTDSDGDGFAISGARTTYSCGACGPRLTGAEPTNRTNTDCDDSASGRSPSVTDICGDRIDNDCDGVADDEANNACGGSCMQQLIGRPGDACTNGKLGACLRTGTYACQIDMTLRCTAEEVSATTELCDGVDNDCDGVVDEEVRNACGGCEPLANAPGSQCQAGSQACASDGVYTCQGANAVVCSAISLAPPTWFPDCDGDGYAVLEGQLASCEPPIAPPGCLTYLRNAPVAGTTLDCDDNSPLHFPGQLLSFSTSVKGTAGGYDYNCDGKLEVDTQEMIITSSSTGLGQHTKFCNVSPTCGPTCPPGQSDLPCDSLACARIVTPSNSGWSGVVCGMVTAVTFGRLGNGYCDVFPSAQSWVKCR